MSKFKNNKKIILFCFIGIILISGIFLLTNNKEEVKLSKEEYIQEVLETEDYSYLPEPAKNYIASVYEETGEVIKTEKNKEEGKPYLNPRYVEYLINNNRSIVNSTLIKESEKKVLDNYNLIPKETIIDFYKGNMVSAYNSENLPSSYDLRNVNNNNYVTPIKNQDDLGLCWSFASNAQLESYLLKRNNQTYTNEATIFSERQMDYALSINGIKEFNNKKYGYRTLGSGGNFRMVTDLAKEGLSFVSQNAWKNIYKNYFSSDYVYNNLNKMELKDVLNYNNSLYEVNSTIEMPYLNIGNYDVNTQEYMDLKESYLTLVKNYVMEYGGAYVGTGAPKYGCSIYDSDLDNYIIYDNNKCNLGSHGMQIIGWDDSIEYEFCAADGKTTLKHSTDLSNCSDDRIIKGKGVWILKNSWGETSDEFTSYTYLAYDSFYTDINMTTDVSLSEEKKWDYSDYIDRVLKNNKNLFVDSKNYHIFYDYHETNNDELKIEKIKFYTSDSNATYNLFISKTGKIDNFDKNTKVNFELVDTISIEMPGLYTFDISDKNINVFDGYVWGISGASYSGALTLDTYHYYSLVEDNTKIKTFDVSYKNTKDVEFNDDYELYVYSNTSNISSDSIIDYKLFDLDGNDISDSLSYKYNLVSDNNVNSLFTISNTVEPGEYILKSLYNNEIKCESKIYLSEIKVMNGTGVENDPYIITTPDELYMINDDMDAYYELGNDIDLTIDTSNPGGKFYNEGKGWVPIGGENEEIFNGNLDGKNHKIIGLTMNDSVYHGGLFYWIAPKKENDYISIKNLIFKNINIESFSSYDNFITNAGVLAGGITDGINMRYYSEDNINIDIKNIAIIDSKISGRGSSASLVGSVSSAKENSIVFDSIFSNSLVYNKRNYIYSAKGGIIGSASIQNDYEENANIKMKNIQNMGTLTVSGDIYPETNQNTYYNYGGIVGDVTGKLDLENVINVSKFSNTVNNYKERVVYGSIIGFYKSIKYFTGETTLKNIYYTQNNDIIGNANHIFTQSNVLKKDLFDLKEISLYTNWNNELEKFDDNWKIETIDSVKRIPILKFVDFDYLKVNEINDLYEESTINIYDYITPNNNLVKDNTTFEIKDDSIATIDEDGNISGLNAGATILHIESEYDGYANDITLNVKNAKYLLTFNSNYGEEEIYIQKFNVDEKKLEINKFERVGYRFKEWNTQKDGNGTSYSDEQLISLTDHLTLYAIWEPISYTIEFNSNGGTGAMDFITLTYETSVILNNTFERIGYKFSGWNTESDGSGTSYINKQEISKLTTEENKIITLYAIWEPISYTIEFNSNGGTGTIDSITLTYETSVILTNTFERIGYKFSGWNTESDGSGTNYIDKQEVSKLMTEDNGIITLYAQWQLVEYKVSFDSNDENITIFDDVTNYFAFAYYEEEIKLTNEFKPIKGYKFAGWNTESDGLGTSYSNGQVIKVTEDITLYAQWEPIKYTIEFDSNGGTGMMESIELKYNEERILTNNFTFKKGYKVIKWNTKSDGSGESFSGVEKIKNLTDVDGNKITLYAIWEPIKYIVKFVHDNKYTEQEFIYDQKQKLKTNSFVKTGYSFLEWFLDENSNIKYKDNQEVINLTSEEETIILWAAWSKNKYIIKFNSNGGTGKMENQQMAYDIPLNLSSNIFKKDGYKFKEWNTQADGKGVSYDDKQEVINLTNVKDEVINLYAIWEKNENINVLINNYKNNNNEVSDITNSTTINNYLKNFSYNNSLQVKVFNFKNELITDNNKLIGTGSKVKFYDNGKLVNEFTNIVRADNTGDGVVDLADLSKLFNHYRGNITMSGVYLQASNITGDSNVDLADLSKLYNYYRGNIKEI